MWLFILVSVFWAVSCEDQPEKILPTCKHIDAYKEWVKLLTDLQVFLKKISTRNRTTLNSKISNRNRTARSHGCDYLFASLIIES